MDDWSKLKMYNETYKKRLATLSNDDLIESILPTIGDLKVLGRWIKAIYPERNFYYEKADIKESITMFLVGCAKYHYNDKEGGFWDSVRNYTDLNTYNQREVLTKLFKQTICKYNLNTFKEIADESYTNIAPMICHAGIPQNCLFSFFDSINILIHQNIFTISNIEEELLYECRYVNKTVMRNLKFRQERGTLFDYIYKIVEMMKEVQAGKTDSINDKEANASLLESITKWLEERKGTTGQIQYKKIRTPMLFLDTESYNFYLDLPEIEDNENEILYWKINDGEAIKLKKLYGIKKGENYVFESTNIKLDVGTNIFVELLDISREHSISSFEVKKQEDIIFFKSTGVLHKSKNLPIAGIYFLTSKNIICNNYSASQIKINLHECNLYYINLNAGDKFEVIDNKGDVQKFFCQAEIQVIEGKRVFDSSFASTNYDLYCQLPYISLPIGFEWYASIQYKREEAKNVYSICEDIINIQEYIESLYGQIRYGLYTIKVSNKNYGTKSIRIVYLPEMEIIRKKFFPRNNIYEDHVIGFKCNSFEMKIANHLNQFMEKEVTISKENDFFTGTIFFEDNQFPFVITLKPISWQISNEIQMFGEKNTCIEVSTKDISDNDETLLSIKNYTNEIYSVNFVINEEIIKSCNVKASNITIINLNEYIEIFTSATGGICELILMREQDEIAMLAKVKINISIKNFKCSNDYVNYYLSWNENGSCKNRTLRIKDVFDLSNIKTFRIPDHQTYFFIRIDDIDELGDIIIEIEQDQEENIYSGLVEECKKILMDDHALVIARNNEINIEVKPILTIKEYEKAIDKYLIYNTCKIKQFLGNRYQEAIDAISERIQVARKEFGDAILLEKLFTYKLTEKLINFTLNSLQLWLPIIINPLINKFAIDNIEKYSKYLYYLVLYGGKIMARLLPFIATEGSINSIFIDKESWEIIKEELAFKKYNVDTTFLSSIKQIKHRTGERERDILLRITVKQILLNLQNKVLEVDKELLLEWINYLLKKCEKKLMTEVIRQSLEEGKNGN